MIRMEGLQKLTMDLDELGAIPDDTMYEMLEAGGEVIAKGQRDQLSAAGIIRSGTLRGAIKVSRKKGGGRSRWVTIYPQGPHHNYNPRHGGSGTTTANDVGFVQETGSKRNRANQWMRIANEKSIDGAITACERVYNDYLKSKNF